jgi:hypothetical protein
MRLAKYSLCALFHRRCDAHGAVLAAADVALSDVMHSGVLTPRLAADMLGVQVLTSQRHNKGLR